MNQLTTTSDQFSFPARELSQQLLEHIHSGSTGYWQHQFDRLANRPQIFEWNLGIVNGQIIYSGSRTWSVQSLMRIVHRYIPQAQKAAVKIQIDALKQQALAQALTPAQLLAQMKQLEIVDETQLIAALQTKVLNDLDIYLLMGSGSAKFVADPNLAHQLPLDGFSPLVLLEQSKQRQKYWYQVKQQVPSMNLMPNLNRVALETANLSPKQHKQIEKLVQSTKSLNSIADEMGRDTLEVAEMFAKLVKKGFVNFTPIQKTTPATIMVIDDSPLMLTQFQHWVSALGYPVVVCQQANMALETIAKVKPAAVFIDINMPEISGFELVKQIRLRPELAGIPLAILTGEQKLSNKWRAQWSGCEFLTKPLTSAAIGDFQVQLEELLPRLLAPTPSIATTNNSLN
jgi:CheY-like chemotaxis protein